MRMTHARVRNYRSIRDTGWFEVEGTKTILVGPNEAGKTAILEALRRLNPPEGVEDLIPLRDYPRKLYNADIQLGKRDPCDIPVVSARFSLEQDDLDALPGESPTSMKYCCTRFLDNELKPWLEDGPEQPVFDDTVRNDLLRLAAHADKQLAENDGNGTDTHRTELDGLIADWQVGTTIIDKNYAAQLRGWLDSILPDVDEHDQAQGERHSRLLRYTRAPAQIDELLEVLRSRLPTFVYFNSYFSVRPNLHLRRLAERLKSGVLDDDRYDYGNSCLLRLLGFEARELSDLGSASDPGDDDPDAFERYRSQLDERQYKLNAAGVRLTEEVGSIWNPKEDSDEAHTVRIQADGQYLKVVVQDELGVEVELDQRSAGFQWLVSFFVVFFAEADAAHANAVLLLDEPGLSLHGLKQREFRRTISRLADGNQTVYTTHSPFLVGPDELDLVRVVEMTDRDTGTKVHTTVSARDSAALLVLQEAFGYDLAQSLFFQERNLVLEGLTDFWYLEATAHLLRDSNVAFLDERIALVPASSAGKVVYFATILHANSLKVAALLDSDNAGEEAAKQDTLVNNLGNRCILRTRDVYPGEVSKPEIEDLLRETLVTIANSELNWDVSEIAANQPRRRIVGIFESEIADFSKYRLAKAYLRWTREHSAADLTQQERRSWKKLVERVNRALE